MDFVGTHRGNRVGADGLFWGVDSMCAVLSEHGIHIAPSTYYEHLNRGPSTRMLTDAQVIDAIYMLRKRQLFMKVFGSRKVWIVLLGNGVDVARCTVERVMREIGWRGALEKKSIRTTVSDPAHPRAKDLVDRQFMASAPNRLWVADFTYCRTQSGWAFTAFVVDVFARKIVGWKVTSEMTADLVLAAIDNAIDSRRRCGVIDLSDIVHHSDAGSQDRLNLPSTQRSRSGSAWPKKESRPRSAVSAIATTVSLFLPVYARRFGKVPVRAA
ncbi:DDE-type integrase/transposase/recombinase [Rhodococcus sp. KBS0724]|uniref:DDE-type integrase/transposase/recombinase n=1 Tax=Rhodococcus sp. KBS0724 TaxID=1179674 RepID=UPI0011859F32|nr:DDE-type integrase/transposase/recombinase [Rhodococcus sp. KBS0724]TSD39678.1 DDE-type integrase/transposase/recombinase [Rhodococcus sp. KBS0724]